MGETPAASASGGFRTRWRSSRLPPGARTVAYAPSGERIAVGTSGGGGFGHTAGSLTVLNAQTGEVVRQIADDWSQVTLAFSPDSRFLVTSESRFHSGVTDERRVRVLEAETLAERCRSDEIGHSGLTEDLAFGRDGTWVAGSTIGLFASSGDVRPTVYVLDAVTAAQRWTRQFSGIAYLVLAPDSGSIAVGHSSAGGEMLGTVVLNPADGAERLLIGTTPGQHAHLIAYSPDSSKIIAACVDGKIRVYDAADGSVLSIAEHGGSSIAVSDDGRWATANRTVRDPDGDLAGLVDVLDVARGTPRWPPVQVKFWEEVRFSPTLRHVIVLSKDGWGPHPSNMEFGLTAIDARTGGRHRGSADAIKRFAVAPDGGSVAALIEVPSGVSERFIDLYDLEIEVSHLAVESDVTALTVSPGGTPLVAVAGTGSTVTVIDAASGIRLANKPIPGGIASLAFAGQGQAVAVGGGDGVRVFPTVGADTPGGPFVWRADTIGTVNALAVGGAGGEWIATAAGKTVRLLSSLDGQARWPNPNAHPQTVTRIAAGSDGKWIATGCVDRRTRILDAVTGTETFSAEGDGRVQALAFTPDGSLLAAANQDGNVILVDAAAASERGRVTRPFACSRIAFSADGALLAAAWDDNTVSIFDIAGGDAAPPMLRELAFTAPVSGLAFNPAADTFAVATEGASAVVYDARDGGELVRILQPAPVSHLAFSADGALIATAGDDRVVRVWLSGSGPLDKEILP